MKTSLQLKCLAAAILQEDGVDQKLSVFHLFSELFPEYANDKDRDGGSTGRRMLAPGSCGRGCERASKSKRFHR